VLESKVSSEGFGYAPIALGQLRGAHGGKMDQYLVLTTTTEQPLATRACDALEDAGIPLLLEHIEMSSGKHKASGYRLLVPSRFSQRARRLVDIVCSSLLGAKNDSAWATA
jgi:hypothetical protein